MALMSDVHAAFRALIAARGFTVIAVLTLSAGLAIAGAIVTVVNAYVWRALPYPAANRLYRVDYAAPGQPGPRGMELLDWTSLDDVIEHPIAWDLDVFYLLGRDYPESAPGAWVSPGYVTGLGIRTARGRVFEPADYLPGSPSVAVISHRLWQSRFGGDAAIIGRTFNAYVSDRPEEPEAFTIVGVLPADLWHLNVYTEVLAPLRAPSFPYQVRLRERVTPEAAAQRIDDFVRRGVSSLPPQYGIALTRLQDSYVAALRPLLWSVVAGAALVVLIAATNVAVLTIVRARTRERELAVRMALGASHVRVARLLALEGVVVGGLSTVIGVSIAAWVMPALAPIIERSLDRRVPGGLMAFTLDGQVAAVVIACGAIVTVVITFIPVALLSRTRHTMTLGSATRGATDGAGAGRSRAILIALEVATSLTLLAGASLMAESALRMLRVDFGIDGDGVMTAGLALRQRSMPDAASRASFYERLEAELRGVGGSTVVAFGDWWPLQGSRPRRAEGNGSGSVIATANPFAISSRYFDALGMRLLEGRTFSSQDRFGSEPVVIVSASLAGRMWPQQSALGQPLTIHPDGDEPLLAATVVGVVNDVRQSHADADRLDAYLPLAQRASRFAFVYLRGPSAPSWERDVRAAIARVHAEVAMGTPRGLEDGLEQERARPRLLAYLLTTFALFACALALVGMHGVIAYAVRQRQREIAVRMAVGADPRAVTVMFLRYGASVLAAGLLGGLAGAVGLGRILRSQLYGVEPAEPRVLAAATLVLATCALAAVIWPARRGASVDPARVLKDE